MSTTGMVMTVTDELLAELEAAAGKATQGRWCTDSQAWVCAADSDQLNAGFVISICDGPDDLKNADYISKAGPQIITALTTELRRLRAENAELAQSLAESRANDQAAMGWLTSLRWASGDRGERMLPELVTHIEGMAKDAGRYQWLRDVGELTSDQFGAINEWLWGDGDFTYIAQAIDTAMATQ